MLQEDDAVREEGRTWDGSKVVIVIVALLLLFLAVVILLNVNGGGHDMDDMGALHLDLSRGSSASRV